jgi:hypothetical protein
VPPGALSTRLSKNLAIFAAGAVGRARQCEERAARESQGPFSILDLGFAPGAPITRAARTLADCSGVGDAQAGAAPPTVCGLTGTTTRDHRITVTRAREARARCALFLPHFGTPHHALPIFFHDPPKIFFCNVRRFCASAARMRRTARQHGNLSM